MKTMYRPWAALALLLPLIAGCANRVMDPAPRMTAGTADDFAIQTVASLGFLSSDVQLAFSTTPPAAPAAARRVAPARALWDTTIVVGGITWQASRDFYDALDNVLPGYGPTAVRVRWTSRAYGTYETVRDSGSVGHDAVLDLRGIQAGQDTLTLDGTCRDTLQNRFRSLDGTRQRYFHWVSRTSVQAVQFLKSTLQTDGEPISGVVTFTVSADRLRSNNITDVDAHFDAEVVVVFDGSGLATISVGTTYHYLWNLTTGAIIRA